MSKKLVKKQINLESTIMAKVTSHEIAMKPRWYFVVGSLLLVAGLVGSSLGAIFLTNLTLFLLRQHGPMGQWRLQQLLSSFPLWIPIVALAGIILGVAILRKYDFSYKNNFWAIIGGFVITILLTAYVINLLGLNDQWSHQGPMRRFYQQIEGRNQIIIPGEQGQGRGYGRMYQQNQFPEF